jgi:hypothetical protein
MTTLSLTDLATITGGANTAGCPTPTQFQWMKDHMVGNIMAKNGGVQAHVVQNDARRCGFPVPK